MRHTRHPVLRPSRLASWRSLGIGLATACLLAVSGCDGDDPADERGSAEPAGSMGFAGADLSLVGEAVTLPDGRQVRPPADWQPAAPQVLEQVRQQASIDAGPFMTEAHAIWIAPEGDGMLIVSEVRPAIDGSEGTGAGEPDIVAAVRSQFADRPGVHEETFITPGGVAVWQFRIEVEQPVAGWSVKLLLPPRDDGSRVQLDYFMASQSVPRLMQSVGTSISTISEAGNGAGEGAAVGGEDGTN